MFDHIFERSDALRRQFAGPLREARLAYLHHRAEQGAPRSTLRTLAQYLLVVAERLNVRSQGTVIAFCTVLESVSSTTRSKVVSRARANRASFVSLAIGSAS